MHEIIFKSFCLKVLLISSLSALKCKWELSLCSRRHLSLYDPESPHKLKYALVREKPKNLVDILWHEGNTESKEYLG